MGSALITSGLLAMRQRINSTESKQANARRHPRDSQGLAAGRQVIGNIPELNAREPAN